MWKKRIYDLEAMAFCQETETSQDILARKKPGKEIPDSHSPPSFWFLPEIPTGQTQQKARQQESSQAWPKTEREWILQSKEKIPCTYKHKKIVHNSIQMKMYDKTNSIVINGMKIKMSV